MPTSPLNFFCDQCKNQCSLEHKIKYYTKGEYIAVQGDSISYLYLLAKGRVKTEMVSDSGVKLGMEIIEAPYPLAAGFLFAKQHFFPVDVIALENCEVYQISKNAVEKQIALCIGFLRGFMAFSADRTQYLSNRLQVFAQKGIKGKLIYYILCNEKNGNFELKKKVSELANYFGVERPSLSRAIHEMVNDKIITFKNGKGKILDINKALNL